MERPHFALHEISFDQGRPHISEDNPVRCLKCHGSAVRPIFDPYRMWPGVYGSLSIRSRVRIAQEAGAYDLSIGREPIDEVHYVDIVHLALRREVSRDRSFKKLGCNELRAASLLALSGAAPVVPPNSHSERRMGNTESLRQFGRTVFGETCMTCHSGAHASKLPFGTEAELKLVLQNRPSFLDSIRDHLRGQNGAEPMPLGDLLPPAQVDDLLDYLELLLKE